MARTKISEYSATPSDNTDIDGINIAEGCAPSGINNAIREMMSQLKDFQAGTQGDPFNGPHNGTVGATTASTGAFTTLSASGAVTLSGGTANGVPYLNGSKVLTSGTALVFDGTNLGIGTSSPTAKLTVVGGQVVVQNTLGYGATFSNTSGSGMYITLGDTSNSSAIGTSAGNLIFYNNNNTTERARIDVNGNLGIGTSSPTNSRLEVTDGSTYFQWIGRSVGVDRSINIRAATGYNASLLFTQNGVADRWAVGTKSGDGSLYFATGDSLANGIARLTLDTSGNMGLGVTPSAWAAGAKALQLGAYSVFHTGSGADTDVGQNYYEYSAGAYKYINSFYATQYQQQSGQHIWKTAPSGTAGNVISFTQAMTLDSGGNLFVGGTNGAIGFGGGTGFLVQSNGQVSNAVTGVSSSFYSQRDTAGNYFSFWYGSLSSPPTAVGVISTNGTTTSYTTSSDYRLKNITGPITTSGAYIDSLNPVEGTWKANGSTFVGLIAHEVQEASRTQVATGVKDGEEMQGMDYSNAELIANLIAEVKSLRQRLASAGI